MTYWSGIVNETDLCYLRELHSLLDVFGLRSKEIDGLYEWEENSLIPTLKTLCGNCILPINARNLVI